MANKSKLTAGPAEKSEIPRRINYVVSVLMLMFTITVAAIGGLFRFQDNAWNLFNAGLFISVLTVVSLGAILGVQYFCASYRAPTGREICKDMVAALWGVGFSVPLILVALDGQITSGKDRIILTALALIGVLMPAIRPRRCSP